jgi:hypothetical protein
METVHADNVDSDSWKEYELHVLKTLFALKFPMDIICKRLDRSWTSSSLKVIELGLDDGLSLFTKDKAHPKWAKELQN